MFDPTGKKKLSYKCPDCDLEWTRWLDRTERKVRGWCRNCKHLVTPYNTQTTNSTDRSVRVTKIKPLW